MRKPTLRRAFKLSLAVNVLLFALVAWDHLANGSRLVVPLLATYAAFLVACVVLFFSRPQAPAQPVTDVRPLDDEPVAIAGQR